MRTEERKVRYYQFYEVGEMTRAKVLDADKRALEAIKQAQDLIEWLKAHRVELAERYRELEAMESHIRVTLKRQRNWTTNKVFYYLITDRVFADGTEEGIDRIAYPGTERNKAIKEFNDIKKRLPNQEYILDIEKGPWE